MKNPLLKVLFSAVCLFPFSPVHAQYPYVTGNALQLFQVGAPGEKKIIPQDVRLRRMSIFPRSILMRRRLNCVLQKLPRWFLLYTR